METYMIVIGKTATGYSAHCPDVPGCAAVGKTVEKLVANMKKALELHFEGMVEDGDAIPKPGGVDAYRSVTKDLDYDQFVLAHRTDRHQPIRGNGEPLLALMHAQREEFMTTMKATIKGGRLELDAPPDWPDGTEVEIHTLGHEANGVDDAMSPEEIARALAAMDQIVPFEMTDAEETALAAQRRARRELEKQQFAEHAEQLRRQWE